MPNGFVSCARESDDAAPFCLQALYAAWRACRRRKRGSRSAQRYELHLLDQLVETRDALQGQRWSPGRPVCFVTLRPKAREVHAAPFADRVVHHLLVPRLEALWEPGFIHDSYANRRGKGTHAAVARLQTFMRQATHNGTRRAWFLQLDVRNFFVTLDRRILLGLLGQRFARAVRQGTIARPEAVALYRLCRTLLQAPEGPGALRLGPPWTFQRVPPHKRLAEAPPGKGLPIGNLTSQFFANVYLDRLDQFVKHELRCRWYLRYVDDFVLLAEDPATLVAWREQIRDFLRERLALALKDDGVLKPVSQGADFLGYIVRPNYLLVRRRVLHQANAALRAHAQRLLQTADGGVALRLERGGREALRATLASYLGHLGHARAARATAALWQRHRWLRRLLRLGRRGGLLPLWEARDATSLAEQRAFFQRGWPGFTLLLQRGNGCEVLAPGPLPVPWPRPPHRRRAAKRRPGELPLAQLAGLRRRLRRGRVPHLFVAEEGMPGLALKRRVLRLAWAPARAARTTPEGAPGGTP